MGTITINIPQDLQLEYHLDRLDLVEQILDRLKGKPGTSRPRELATPETSPLEELQTIQTFVARINFLFRQIQDWLADELDVVTSTLTLRERGHTYPAPVLTLRQPGQEEVLATLKPKGAFMVATEGLIDVKGWVDNQHLHYLTKDGFQITDASGKKQHRFQGVTQDGWYWIKPVATDQAILIDKTELLNLITWVSDHEF